METTFIYDEEDSYSSAQLKNLRVGESFYFADQKFTKINDLGWVYYFCNIENSTGTKEYLHPDTFVRIKQNFSPVRLPFQIH